ncbi:CYTH and CHAD domain-containing protein [Streptomyces sp. TP-A0356]|uniref:CYTH and CHAD domain-containing protein n=1 Tax=Streptomyces sp. TP-A0356 TaxID=1359208 RepID=UPI0006E29BA6|nr:CYTH and CHAD domain-containing protein [Streptomyces sp. TP-A0356]
MAQSKRETERKYAAPAVDGVSWLPDLTDVDPVASLVDRGIQELDAVYYDTADLRLARSSAALRRRTGGTDAGWHLKLPRTDDSREEVQAPLSDEIPDELRGLALSRTRGAPLRPVVRIRSTRSVRALVNAEGGALAELSLDTVRADSLLADGGQTVWSEMEVELAEDADPALLDRIDKVLGKKGIDRVRTPSKLARALAETAPDRDGAREPHTDVAPGSAGEQVCGYLREQVRALVDLDPAVRRGAPDSVHRMRVTCRRLRGALRSYRSVLDREAVEPIRKELKWLAGQLGPERDHEVLSERLSARVRELPGELVLGPVAARLQVWDAGQRAAARRRTLDALNSPCYTALLDRLSELTTRPPLRAKAARKPEKVMVKALVKEYQRLQRRMAVALGQPSGPERDAAVHQARKAAKRLRYAAQAARPALGKPAKRLGRRVKEVQKVSGDHHDGVVTRDVLRRLAVAAHAAGEPSFTWGLLHGQERAAAGAREQQLPAVWERASDARLRKALG